jgi:DNA-binding transcriptional LysR family regulator
MSTTGTPANHQLVQISSQEGVIAAVLAGVGLGIIFDQGAALDPRLTVLSIRGPEMISYLDLVCLHERGTSHAISGFLTISREYLQEHEPGSVVAARGGSCKTTRRSCAR